MKFRDLSREADQIIGKIATTNVSVFSGVDIETFIKGEVRALDLKLQGEMLAARSFTKAWTKKREELSFLFSLYHIADDLVPRIGGTAAWNVVHSAIKKVHEKTAWRDSLLVKLGLQHGLVILNVYEIDTLIIKQLSNHEKS